MSAALLPSHLPNLPDNYDWKFPEAKRVKLGALSALRKGGATPKCPLEGVSPACYRRLVFEIHGPTVGDNLEQQIARLEDGLMPLLDRC
jgi:hypothetical protein